MYNLNGKKGLVVGIANSSSIAYGCAKTFSDAGAELAITYLNEKTRTYVEPLLDSVNHSIFTQLDVEKEGQLEVVFAKIEEQWGKLDFIVHSIAFAPAADLHGRVIDSSKEGFMRAMDISCHSFARMARLAEPLMTDGGSMITMSYLGADDVVNNYGIMGPVKSALQSLTRYMAADLGPKGIRVNAISPGPLLTRASSGIKEFDALMSTAIDRAPMHKLVTTDDIGKLAGFLVSDAAKMITGETLFIDGGYHIVGS